MAPEVERFTKEGSTQEYFCVNLISLEEFNAVLFDEQFDLIKDPIMSQLKYIVIDDRMFLFPVKQSHLYFYHSITKDPNSKLQSAGRVTVLFAEGRFTTRVIDGYAESLESILPIEASDQYRSNELKPKLDQFFKFPDL